MNKIIFKIIAYTSIISLIGIVFKVCIQNNYFHNNFSLEYFIACCSIKIVLLSITVIFFKKEKIQIEYYNNKKWLFLVFLVIVISFTYINTSELVILSNSPLDVIKFIFYTVDKLIIGIFEEIYFRLIIFILICSYFKYSLLKSTIITSLFFALVHISNILLKNYSLSDVMFQLMLAFAIGLCFQLLFINFKNIYIPILLHFFIDFDSGLSTQFFKIPDLDLPNNSFDYNTFFIALFLILISLIFTYFNLRQKHKSYFIIQN